MRSFVLTFLLVCFAPAVIAQKNCSGHFVNPVADICWKCLFPLSFGKSEIVHHGMPDPKNANELIGHCGNRIGMNIGYWEPSALVDITETPFCMVNLGGFKLNMGHLRRHGGKNTVNPSQMHGFYHMHWYKYPLMSWLNIIFSSGCLQGGDFDVAYFSELDPTWKNSAMAFVLHPESVLFANPITQASCSADAVSALNNRPLSALFWCAGSLGSVYPLTGHLNAPFSPIQTAMLLAERANFKMHRLRLITDSSPEKGAICVDHHYPVTPKERYRYEMVNQVADGKHCYGAGHTPLTWEAGKINAAKGSHYGVLVWRKRNCTYL